VDGQRAATNTAAAIAITDSAAAADKTRLDKQTNR